ncbi:MAG TPA: baseplate J/gp47 family protein [Acidiphilium sp.]|nr:baseplate J/gp47 family protein [Acidiphilium sp.]
MAAAAQSACSQALDFTVGSVLNAITQAQAGLGLWLQYLVLTVLQQAILTLCTGTQVDYWLAQFSAFGGRLPGTYATGTVTFSRFTTVTSALISVGSFVRTADGTQTFTVTTDTTNAYWNTSQGGYLIPAGTSSAAVPVQAVNVGTQGNVGANTITLVVGSVPGIDTVNNSAAFTNGLNAESDAAVKVRFQNWLNTRALGTEAAVLNAVSDTQANLTYSFANNQTGNGTYTPGTFTVTIDDGSGATPDATVGAVQAAIALVQPVGSNAVVQAATPLLAMVSMVLTVSSAGVITAAEASVSAALSAFIGSLGVGDPLPFSRLGQIAYGADPTITNVTGIVLNGSIADLVPTPSQVIRVGSISVD